MNNDSVGQRLVSLLAFPLGVVCAIGLAVALPAHGVRVELAVMAAFVSSILWVRLAETVVP